MNNKNLFFHTFLQLSFKAGLHKCFIIKKSLALILRFPACYVSTDGQHDFKRRSARAQTCLKSMNTNTKSKRIQVQAKKIHNRRRTINEILTTLKPLKALRIVILQTKWDGKFVVVQRYYVLCYK